ncbi:MAG: class I SAM-dependent methyltransferase [Nevskiaceae bacterium]|jgi:predicted O-methyltransferase YrrM|nr:class I SAM-dependent methyltransferase [Nevskiaceae bacterium]
MPSSGFDKVLEIYRQRVAAEARQMHEVHHSATRPATMHRDELLLSVGEDVAQLCVDLIVGRNAQIIVELGTSYGFSTLFLAEAARRTGGKVFTYEIHPDKQRYAQQHIEMAGLSAQVEWRLGDAVALLASQPGPIDFVLLDLWKDLYIPCLDAFYPQLATNGVIVADNMLYPEFSRAEGAAYRAAVRTRTDIEAVLLPIGQGIDLACRSR